MKKEKDVKKHGTLSNTAFAIAWYFKISPAYTVYRILNSILGDVVALFEHTFLAAYIISCVETGKPLKSILYFLIPVAAAVAIKVTQGPIVSAYIAPKFNAKFKKAVHLRLYEKAGKMEIAKYDNAEFYNDFVWAMQEAPSHITASFDTFCNILAKLTVTLIAGTYVAFADAYALIAAAIIVPIAFFAYKKANKLYIKREEEVVPLRRKRDYVNRVFYLADYVKDIKQGKMAKKTEKDFEDVSKELEDPVKKYGVKLAALYVFNSSVGSTVWDFGFLSYLFYQAIVKSKFGLGRLLGIYNSGSRFIGNLTYLTRIYPDFEKHSLYIEKLRTFLETENTMPDNGTKAVPSGGDIVLENLNFTYPACEKPTLNGISLKIKRGEKIALVGFNGAGKSTLIKLILRLYDPTGGSISYGGKNITEYPLKDYRESFGVLFQDFEIIATDIAGNIAMDSGEFDKERADKALKKVGFWEKFQTLPDGYATRLTKEFDDSGVNLSGGEAQKLALARVLYSKADIIILDEPSSALDPLAEYQLNKTVTELAEDKTVIIISHRLSTTRFADKIYMLENGRIIESGTHNEMLNLNGKYAEMFALQAEKYTA